MSTEDASVFFDLSTPGVIAGVINGTTVAGALEADMSETLESETQRNSPMWVCAKAALPAVNVGDVLAAGGLNYVVRAVETNDFDPVAVLHLNNP